MSISDDARAFLSALLGDHKAGIDAQLARIDGQNVWMAENFNNRLAALENMMSTLTDAIALVIADRDHEKANAANADALTAQVATLTAEVATVTQERDAALADVAAGIAAVHAALPPVA